MISAIWRSAMSDFFSSAGIAPAAEITRGMRVAGFISEDFNLMFGVRWRFGVGLWYRLSVCWLGLRLVVWWLCWLPLVMF